MRSDSLSPFAAAPQRTPVEFDPVTGGLRIGPHERRVDDPSQPEQVYGAYLSLLYAVRNARPGQRLALRAADLEALLLIVGDDPDTIESRLVGLMGCTPEEASTLARLLLRQRKTTAALGIAGLTLAGIGVGQLPGGGSEPVPVTQSVEQSQPVSQPLPVSGDVQLPAEQPVPAPVAAPVVVPVEVGPVAADRSPSAPRPAVGSTVVVAAEAPAPAPAPVTRPAEPVLAAPPAPPVEQPAAAPAPAPEPAPAVADADRYVMPLNEQPVWDAPPPPVDEPLSDIGEAISVVAEPVTPISGVTESGRDLPAEPGSEPPADAGEAVLPQVAPVVTEPEAEPEPAAPVEQISGVTDSTHDGAAAPAVEQPAP